MPSASLNVPHFKQELQYSCFAACARMVFAFFGHLHTEAEFRAAMKTDSGGTRATLHTGGVLRGSEGVEKTPDKTKPVEYNGDAPFARAYYWAAFTLIGDPD